MSESATKWLIVGALALLVLTYVTLAKRIERRRAQHFNLLAVGLEATVDRSGNSARFCVKVDERDVEVRDEYRGGGLGSSGSGARYISIVTPLRGRSWDLHSVEIRRRPRLAVEEFGLPMREGWLTADVRSRIEAFFAVADSYGRISMEGGTLIYRVASSPRNWSVAALKNMVNLLAGLAAAIEGGQST